MGHLDALDSELERRGGDGVWGTDECGIHTAGTLSADTSLGVVCVIIHRSPRTPSSVATTNSTTGPKSESTQPSGNTASASRPSSKQLSTSSSVKPGGNAYCLVAHATSSELVIHLINNPRCVKMSPLNEVRRELLAAMTTRSHDALIGLVADRHRRLAIQQLRKDVDGETTFDDLVDRLLGDESLADHNRIDREKLAIQLYHAHLPKLADHGVVEFDPENRVVRYQPDEQIETVLDSLSDELPAAHP